MERVTGWLSRRGAELDRIRTQVATFFRSGEGLSRKRLALAGVAGVAVLACIGAGIYLLIPGQPATASAPPPSTTTTVAAPKRAPLPRRHVARVAKHPDAPPTCPLTGLRPPNGKVPQRALLAVKVGNNPTARPQSGLNRADIVFDTLAEGGITRYIAVYQCNEGPMVGPVRSVRWDDWHILEQFGHAGLAFVGGITPDQDAVASMHWICNLNDFVHPNLYYQNPNRVRPDATYTSTEALWSACSKSKPPQSPFHFGRSVQPGSTKASGVEIDYSGYATDILWQWSAAKRAYLHSFREGGTVVPDYGGDRLRVKATNVLIEVVNLQYGPYAESPGSTGDVESITVGHGPAYLLRNGRLVRGTWVRKHWAYLTRFMGPHGRPFVLEPGNTWVEIVPRGDPISFTR